MLFWLTAYLIVREGFLDLLMWSIRASVLLAGYFTVRAIVRGYPRYEEPTAAQVIAQIRMPSAYADMHERGCVCSRADYDAWLLSQTDAWLVIYHHESEASTSDEATEPTTGPFPTI